MIQAKSRIDNKIEELQQQLTTVKGRETEQYARIVGYYRSVKNWNKGKKEEYKYRVNFSETTFNSEVNGKIKELKVESEKIASYKFFFRTTCPNCPPVKNLIDTLEIPGESINADNSAGFTKAAVYEIFAAPTVIFLDTEENEIYRTSTPNDIKELLKENRII